MPPAIPNRAHRRHTHRHWRSSTHWSRRRALLEEKAVSRVAAARVEAGVASMAAARVAEGEQARPQVPRAGRRATTA